MGARGPISLETTLTTTSGSALSLPWTSFHLSRPISLGLARPDLDLPQKTSGRTLSALEEPWLCTLLESRTARSLPSAGGAHWDLWSTFINIYHNSVRTSQCAWTNNLGFNISEHPTVHQAHQEPDQKVSQTHTCLFDQSTSFFWPPYQTSLWSP